MSKPFCATSMREPPSYCVALSNGKTTSTSCFHSPENGIATDSRHCGTATCGDIDSPTVKPVW